MVVVLLWWVPDRGFGCAVVPDYQLSTVVCMRACPPPWLKLFKQWVGVREPGGVMSTWGWCVEAVC